MNIHKNITNLKMDSEPVIVTASYQGSLKYTEQSGDEVEIKTIQYIAHSTTNGGIVIDIEEPIEDIIAIRKRVAKFVREELDNIPHKPDNC